MPTDCSQDSLDFGTVEGRRVVGAFDGGQITSHAGGLLLGGSNRAIRLVDRLARCFQDGRDPDALLHTVPALLGQRIFAIALGYEDINDHDHLRHDPVLQVLAGKLTAKRSNCAALAGKSTLNRLEHAAKVGSDPYHKISYDEAGIAALFVTLCVESYAERPTRMIIDLDATHDPIHGDQEGRHFHGYYDCLYERRGVKSLLPSAQSFCSTSVLIFSSRPWFPNSAARKIGQGRRASAARRARP